MFSEEQYQKAARYLEAHDNGTKPLSEGMAARIRSDVAEYEKSLSEQADEDSLAAGEDIQGLQRPPDEVSKVTTIPETTVEGDPNTSALFDMEANAGSALNYLNGLSFGQGAPALRAAASTLGFPGASRWMGDAQENDPHPFLSNIGGALTLGRIIGPSALLSATGTAAAPLGLSSIAGSAAISGASAGLGHLAGEAADYGADTLEGTPETPGERVGRTLASLPRVVGVGGGLGAIGTALGALASKLRTGGGAIPSAVARNEDYGGSASVLSGLKPPPGLRERVLNQAGENTPLDVAVGRVRGPLTDLASEADSNVEAAAKAFKASYGKSPEGSTPQPMTELVSGAVTELKRLKGLEGGDLPMAKPHPLQDVIHQAAKIHVVEGDDAARLLQAHPGAQQMPLAEAERLGLRPNAGQPSSPGFTLPGPTSEAELGMGMPSSGSFGPSAAERLAQVNGMIETLQSQVQRGLVPGRDAAGRIGALMDMRDAIAAEGAVAPASGTMNVSSSDLVSMGPPTWEPTGGTMRGPIPQIQMPGMVSTPPPSAPPTMPGSAPRGTGTMASPAGDTIPPGTVPPVAIRTPRAASGLPSVAPALRNPTVVIVPRKANATTLEDTVGIIDTAAKAEQAVAKGVPEWVSRMQADVRKARARFGGNASTARAPEATVDGPDGTPMKLPAGSYAARMHQIGESIRDIQERNIQIGLRPGMDPKSLITQKAVGDAVSGLGSGASGQADAMAAANRYAWLDPSFEPLLRDLKATNTWNVLEPQATVTPGGLSFVTPASVFKNLKYRLDPVARTLQDTLTPAAIGGAGAQAQESYDSLKATLSRLRGGLPHVGVP